MIVFAISGALAMSAPRATAFAQACDEMRRDEPGLRCTRVKKLRVDGHPIEIWETVAPRSTPNPCGDASDDSDTVQLFVAIDTNAGWYVSEPLLSLDSFEPREHTSTSTSLAKINARVVRDGHHHVARVRAVEDWDHYCPPCDDGHGPNQRGETVIEATCAVDDALVPHCDLPDPPAAQ